MFKSMKICTNDPDELQRLLFSQGYRWHPDSDGETPKILPLWPGSWIFTYEDGTISWDEHDSCPDAPEYSLVYIQNGEGGHYALEETQCRLPK